MALHTTIVLGANSSNATTGYYREVWKWECCCSPLHKAGTVAGLLPFYSSIQLSWCPSENVLSWTGFQHSHPFYDQAILLNWAACRYQVSCASSVATTCKTIPFLPSFLPSYLLLLPLELNPEIHCRFVVSKCYVLLCAYFPFDPLAIYLHIKQCAVSKYNVTRHSSSDNSKHLARQMHKGQVMSPPQGLQRWMSMQIVQYTWITTHV